MAKRIIRRNVRTGRIEPAGSSGIGNAGDTIDGTPNPSGDTGPIDSGPNDGESGSGQATAGNGAEFVDPAGASGSRDPESNTPGNGGTGNRGKWRRGKSQAVPGHLTSLLFSIHLMGAQILKVPEMALSEAEAKKLDAAVTEVMRFYTDVEISPVVQAWLNLAMVGGVIYGPRIMAHNIRKKAQAKTIDANRPVQPSPFVTPPTSANVTPIKPPAAQKPQEKPQPGWQQPVPSLNLQEWSRWNGQSAAIPVSE